MAECKLCGRNIKTSGNTSNLKPHLNSHTNKISSDNETSVEPSTKKRKSSEIRDYFNAEAEATCSNTNPARDVTNEIEDESETAYRCDDNDETKSSFASTSSTKSKEVVTIQPQIKQAFTSIASFGEGGKKHARITDALVYFICKDNMPLSIVEGTGFNKFIKEISPLYKIPSRNTIKSRIINKFDAISIIFKDKLSKTESLAITSDIWSETMSMRSFLGITVHFLEGSSLLSTCLDVIELSESHTGEYIFNTLKEVLNKWKIDEKCIMAVVTDNDAKMLKAVDLLVGKNKHLSCFAHTINLTVENAIKQSGLDEFFSKIRNIVKFIKASINGSDDLRKEQLKLGIAEGKLKKVILDVSTRWNSTYYMCERFLELINILNNILINRPNSPPMLTAAEVELLKQVLLILKVMEKLTVEISGEKYLTVSIIIPMINCTIKNYSSILNIKLPLALSLKECLLKEIEKRFGAREQVNLLAIGSFLDPRFKNVHFNNAVASSRTLQKTNNMVLEQINFTEDISTTSDDEQHESSLESKDIDIWSFHKSLSQKQNIKSKHLTLSTETITTEVRMHLSAPLASVQENPLQTWEELKLVYPHLYKIARKYLVVVGTSVPSERLFSRASDTITQARNRLSGKLLPKLLFLGNLPIEYW